MRPERDRGRHSLGADDDRGSRAGPFALAAAQAQGQAASLERLQDLDMMRFECGQLGPAERAGEAEEQDGAVAAGPEECRGR